MRRKMDSKSSITQQLHSLIAKSNSFLNEEKNKQKTIAYIYVILSLITLSAFGIFAIGPTLTTISELNKQYEENNEVLEALEKKNTNLQSLHAQFAQIESDLTLIDNAIPLTPEVTELTRQIEVLATRNNLTVVKLDAGLMELYPAQSATKPIFSYTFSVTVDGGERDINKFVSDVINMQRIIGIERLTTGAQLRENFTASIVGRAFFYRP